MNDREIPDIPQSVNEESNAERFQVASLATWIILFLLRLQAKHYIPDKAMDELIKFLFAYVKILGKYSTFDALLSEKLPS